MNQQQVEAWIAANGGPGSVQYNNSVRRIKNPARTMTNADGSENPNYDPTAPEWIDVAEESWTNSKTGATLRVSRRPAGDFDVLENKTADPNKGPESRNPTQVAADEKAKRDQAERERNAALLPDQDPAYETDAERRARAQATIDRQNRERQEAEAKAEREAQQNRPSVTIRDDGKGGVVAVSVDPKTGQATTKPIPGIVGKPDQITHEGTVYERKPDGTYAPVTGLPTPGAGRKNVEAFTPDYTQPDLGLGAWAAKQRAKIGLPPGQGGISQSDYDASVKEAHGQATTAIANVTSNQTVRRQQAIDEQARRDQQAVYAENDLERKQQIFNDIWKYTTPGSEAIRAWMPDPESAQAMRKRYEADARPMPELHPMFQNMAAQAAATATPPAAQQAAAAASPVPSPPNALGVGAVGNQPAPTGGPRPAGQPRVPEPPGQSYPTPPPGTIADAQAAANAGPVPGQAIVPALLPPAPITADPRVTGQEPGAVAPAAPPSPVFEPGPRPVVPPPDPNLPPNEITKVMPSDPVTAWAQPLFAPQPMVSAPAQQPSGVVASLPQQMPSAFDPYPVAGRLVDLGVPSEAVAEAMREMGLLEGVA